MYINDRIMVPTELSKLYSYEIEGDPIAWARAGHGNGRFYDTQKQLKLLWGLHMIKQHNCRKELKNPLYLYVIFHFPIPKTHAKKRDEMIGKPMPYKPDLSNCLKFLEDAVQGVVYKDDCIISSTTDHKIWSDKASTEFTFWEIDQDQNLLQRAC